MISPWLGRMTQSPLLLLALFCFHARVEVTTYIFREDGGSFIGSAFPGEA